MARISQVTKIWLAFGQSGNSGFSLGLIEDFFFIECELPTAQRKMRKRRPAQLGSITINIGKRGREKERKISGGEKMLFFLDLCPPFHHLITFMVVQM